MSYSVEEDVQIEINENSVPVGRTEFDVPLIVAQSDESGAPTDEYREYTRLPTLTGDYSRSGSPRIVEHASAMFQNGASRVAVLNVDRPSTPTDTDLSTALDNVVEEGFFYVTMTSREATHNSDPQGVSGDRQAVSDWCAANDRIFIATSNVGESVADITSALANNLQVDSTYFLAFEDSTDGITSLDAPVDAGMAGYASSRFPGSINFKFQNLEGFTGSDYTATEVSDIENEGGNVFLGKKSVPQTSGGQEPTGGYIDITCMKLWMKARIRENFLSKAVANDKITYDVRGIQQIGGMIEEVLDRGAQEDLIALDEDGIPQFEVNLPDVDDISQNDRDNRLLPDIVTNVTLAGAIDKVDMTFVLQA